MNRHQLLQQEFQLRVFDESYPRIEKCLNSLNQEQIWTAPNENMVSVGCLVKHLLGNAQQWMLAGVLQQDFTRNRDLEFVAEPHVTKEELMAQMEAVQKQIFRNMKNLTEDQLTQKLVIQGFDTTGFSATVHVIEHFSYHTGQISLLTKLFQNIDLGYYDNHDLDV